MRILDKHETIAWLTDKGVTDSKGMLLLSGFPNPIWFRIPVDSGAKTTLSKIIVSWLDTEGEGLLWIDEFGIWPSAEDRYLFEGFRKFFGEYSPLNEKPGHIFSTKDLDAIGSLIALTLYFCWGAIIVSATMNVIIRISHDEVLDLYAKDKECLSVIQDSLSRLGVLSKSEGRTTTPGR